jgi:hypothetical protein
MVIFLAPTRFAEAAYAAQFAASNMAGLEPARTFPVHAVAVGQDEF